VESPIDRTMRRANFSAPGLSHDSAMPTDAPMHTQVSIAESGGSAPAYSKPMSPVTFHHSCLFST
jgi:hypothetical protein